MEGGIRAGRSRPFGWIPGLAGMALALFAAAAPAAPLSLVATTAELHSLADAVGGDLVASSHLIPAGQDGESFQPRPQDLAKLRDA
ncbi:MAG: metal ABC transporter solute-binding protein, Zn/Mn family, partial [Usitatibacter sp.]